MAVDLKAAFLSIKKQPAKTVTVLFLTALALAYDYQSRLYMPIEASNFQGYDSLQLPISAASPPLTEPIKSWLAKKAAETAQQNEPTEITAVADALKPELAGATELDDFRLLVRATFISGKSNQRLALIELQKAESEPVLQAVREGQTFGRFQLTRIGVHQLLFTDPAQPAIDAIVAPVFAGAPNIQQGSNDVPVN